MNILRKTKTLFVVLLVEFVLFSLVRPQVYAQALTVEFAESPETVFDVNNRCDQNNIESPYNDVPDLPAKAYVDADGYVRLFTAHLVNRKNIGDNLRDVQHTCDVIMDSHKNPDPRKYDDYEWLSSPYTIDGTTVYGLIHTEYHGWEHNNCAYPGPPDPLWSNCWWNSINLAVSTDKGDTFTHAMPPNHNVSNTTVDYNPSNTFNSVGIFEPMNIISKDGYYYAGVYTNIPNGKENFKNCIMRTNNLADPASWFFWDGTSFSIPARGLSFTNDCKKESTTGPWSDYLDKYITVGTWDKIGYVWWTSDLTTWNWFVDYINFDPAKIGPDGANAFYLTYLQPGAETRNFEDISRSPYIYYSIGGNLKRIRVRFNKPEDIGKYDVLDLRFNEYRGTSTLDSSFYGNDGTLSGGASFKQEGSTKYIHFDGLGKVTVPNTESLNLTGTISISFRIRTSQQPEPSHFPVIMTKEDATHRHYSVFLINGGKIHFSVNNSSGGYTGSVTNKAVNDGNWHDIVIKFSDSTGVASYWIDGQPDVSGSLKGSLVYGNSNSPITFGFTGWDGFVGDLDRFTIYNYDIPIVTSNPTPSGDINSDGIVNIQDAIILSNSFGKKPGETGYNQKADINSDGVINILDAIILSNNFTS